MPRGPRLDAPGALHHVMVRGIERRPLFHNDRDRADLVDRLEAIADATGLQVLGWALLPNHFHLLVRTGPRPLATAMRRLLTGYVGSFNRRHRRSGHLVQNRYKSVLVEEEAYLVELVRYIHLNPLRAGIVPTLAALDRYPWTGHSTLLGRIARPWHAIDEVLRWFGRSAGVRRRYRAFVAEGTAQGRRPELQGGGLRRSAGGWEAVGALRRGREKWASDEQILGSSDFVTHILRDAERSSRARAGDLNDVIVRVAEAWQLTPPELTGGGRRGNVREARYVVSYLGVRELGQPAARVGRALGTSTQSVLRGVERGPSVLATRGIGPERFVRQRR